MMDAIMQTDLLYACATHAADRMKSAHLPPVELIANSVDTTLFQDRPKNAALLEELGIGANERVILHVSNYAEAKRTRDLIASAATVLRHRADVSYLFVGDSKRQPDLERQVDLAGIRDKCRFVDWVPHAAMPDHYGIADIVVSTSHSEVLSLVYLEAQACGRLLLASDIQAAREVIADGHTGLLFGAGNVDDLTEKTLTVLDDADLRARIGRAARQFAVTNRDLGDAVARYETTLRRLVERRCPAPAR
jgi:glycosyltransferase involved in cell wall biosynthesis